MTEPTDTPAAKPAMGMLERRGIEAAILKPVYEEMAARLGEAVAQDILGAAITRAAVESAAAFAATEPNGTSLTSFAELQPLWTKDDALRLEVLHQDETRFDYNVTRCRYAEMYREMGLGHIGHLLSCNRDAAFCTGYDPSITMKRTQTIMQGASHCDFRYRVDKPQG
ncbi:L-2-amino-thiazoline-4-carboxylic acid hydrolase [Azospirillum brasilense]|uniref:L-2-amino-thiazoline-4-carboxylic acid hydrolase n=1 Tax=Azospirillum brasilense TaxID=192 RepID=UPI000E69D459|nr:L-2-amino-thiazoline-4-carboxylic acid hydrolase [Azospirillum brasilense]NUB25595.1 2-amino-thiazoline-4-carboxylic acid hydrolase [Azospirillum brasilense]NUB32837.1 2-amino-thiazoline-4-carboxylic acid hydrolase [Azospirillum brasilense]RIW06210.1 2-amino-thiazoline-4-carboxylic acid hydrolase [Azospirillum brasilense]